MTRQSPGWLTGKSPLLRRTSSTCGWLPTPPSSQTATWRSMRRLASSRYTPHCQPAPLLCISVIVPENATAGRLHQASASQQMYTCHFAVLEGCTEFRGHKHNWYCDAGVTPDVLLYRIMWMTSARCMRRTGTARIHSASRWAVLSTSLTSWPCEPAMKRMRTKQTPSAVVPSRSCLLLPAVSPESGLWVQNRPCISVSVAVAHLWFCHGMLHLYDRIHCALKTDPGSIQRQTVL